MRHELTQSSAVLETNHRQTLATSKHKIFYVFSAPGRCTKSCGKIWHTFTEFCPFQARFCTHMRHCKTRGNPPQARFCSPFLCKSFSTYGQQIESATQPKWSDSICKLQLFCMFHLTSVNPPGSHQLLKQGTALILETVPVLSLSAGRHKH